ncbi:hypothetical protein IPG36_01995 [bacterium]|nr:MAG: hypothetical protein IPG36_01995 [bacterium]
MIYGPILVIIGAIIQLAAISIYIRDTLRGQTRPNRMTWLLWSVAPLIATFAAISNGVTWAVLPVFISGFGPLLVLLASFIDRQAYWKLGRLDYSCGLLAVLALVLWGITKNPEVAIIFAIASDALAAAPTIIKAWYHPHTESATPFVLSTFNALTGFTAITAWTFSAFAFPAYLVIINIVLAYSILGSPNRKPLHAKLNA